MSYSPESKAEIKSRSSAKSAVSRTSISVRLPSAHNEEEVRKKPEGKHIISPANFDVVLHGTEIEQTRHLPTPTSVNLSNPRTPSPPRKFVHSSNARHPQSELFYQAAATIIERAWISYRDRQMFRLLKHSVCAAENSLSRDILRKVCPKEGDFLKDKSLQIKVRFRFGGPEFPPMIFFKIYIHSEMSKVKYLSGKRLIKPASVAAEDSLRLMGSRKFYEQMLQDMLHQQQFQITDENDVITLKDYMQYLSTMDETPAHLGGKENYWRKLTLDVLPRHTVFYDVIEYLYSNKMTARLREELPLLLRRPHTQEVQRQQIKLIAEFKAPLPSYVILTPRSKMAAGYVTHHSSRRSKQAKVRNRKLRQMYGLNNNGQVGSPEDFDQLPDGRLIGYDGLSDEEEWEKEADRLYEWTQELSNDNDVLATPRLVAS